MPKATSERVRLISWHGADGDFIYFSCPSATRRDHIHDITICKRQGLAYCSCEYASLRNKTYDLRNSGPQDLYRHLRSFKKSVEPMLKKQGLI